MFLALAKPSTAGAALKMIEEEGFDMGVDIDDELSDLLLAKDDKGNSKLLELIAASEKEEACAALISALCSKSDSIKAAVVSAETFLAMAKPATAGVALKLLETYDIPIDDELSGPLLAEDNTFQWERVEEIVGVPICMLSVGAERDAVIQRSSIFEDGWIEEATGDAPVGAAR